MQAPLEFDELWRAITIPPERRYVSVSRSEASFIYDLIRREQPEYSLEVGLAHGASACAIMAAHPVKHSCMDPFQDETYDNLALRNLQRFGFDDRVDFHQDYAHNVLPALLNKNRIFDFAFLDGGHLFDQILLDFYYVDLLLNQNGLILFHDAWMRSTRMVYAFVHRNKRNYETIKTPCRNLLLVRKTNPVDERAWHSFEEFYTLRSLFSQRLVTWWINRQQDNG